VKRLTPSFRWGEFVVSARFSTPQMRSTSQDGNHRTQLFPIDREASSASPKHNKETETGDTHTHITGAKKGWHLLFGNGPTFVVKSPFPIS